MNNRLIVDGLLGIALLIAFALHRKRRAALFAFYSSRGIFYREWLELYGEEAKPKIQEFLRCIGTSFGVKESIIHKLGPNDGVMDFYHRDYCPEEADALEANRFVDELKNRFGYEAVEGDGLLTMSQLFEKATGLRRKVGP